MQTAGKIDDLMDDRNWYPVKKPIKGRGIIINNFTEKRKGSDKDIQTMSEALIKLGFSEEDVNEYQDLSKEKMEEVIKAAKECGNFDVFMMIIGSHGGRFENEDRSFVRSHDGVKVPVQDIMNHFSNENCPTLAGKPKIFIVQACRGKRENELVKYQMHSASVPEKRITKGSDMLLVQSTVPEYVSWRIPDKGSPFIHYISKRLTEPTPIKRDFHSTCVLAFNDLIDEYTNNVQAAEMTSSLRKLLDLNPRM